MVYNKNVIGALVVLLFACSIWGGVNNRSSKQYKRELEAAQKTLSVLKEELQQAVIVAEAQKKAANAAEKRSEQLRLQSTVLQEEIKQLHHVSEKMQKTRKELVALRKASQRHAAVIAQKEALIAKLDQDLHAQSMNEENTVQELQRQLEERSAAMQKAREEQAQIAHELTVVKQELAEAQTSLERKQEQHRAADSAAKEPEENLVLVDETAQAQILELERLLQEKNVIIVEECGELDRVKSNINVLLSKISHQQTLLQQLEQEKLELAKKLAAANGQPGDQQEEAQQ